MKEKKKKQSKEKEGIKSNIIINVQPKEVTIVVTENGRLMEVNSDKKEDSAFSIGNIYLGQVKKLMPALNAAFVDIGSDKEAFIHYSDLGNNFFTIKAYVEKIRKDKRLIAIHRFPKKGSCEANGKISEALKVGDIVPVQIEKESINSKGPKLTAELSIAGYNMVLIPFTTKVLISSKIRSTQEKTRLRKILRAALPEGFGAIARTLAENKSEEDIAQEVKVLLEKWNETAQKLKTIAPVSLLLEEIGRPLGIIRDTLNRDYDSIQVNDAALYKEIKQYIKLNAPRLSRIVHFYKKDQPIFDHFDITRQLKSGLGKIVNFKSGGYLIMEQTEALFSIDVNSGSKKLSENQEENAFLFNMLAAEEIAHQLRLRDIGGIIIIDFIDISKRDHLNALHKKMVELLLNDRAKHKILPLSPFCLMQITRQRVRPAVKIDVREVCPTCLGKGKVQSTLSFMEKLEEEVVEMSQKFGKELRLHVHPFIFAYLSKGWIRNMKQKWWWKYRIHLVENQSLGVLEYAFYNKNREQVKNEEEKKKNEITK